MARGNRPGALTVRLAGLVLFQASATSAQQPCSVDEDCHALNHSLNECRLASFCTSPSGGVCQFAPALGRSCGVDGQRGVCDVSGRCEIKRHVDKREVIRPQIISSGGDTMKLKAKTVEISESVTVGANSAKIGDVIFADTITKGRVTISDMDVTVGGVASIVELDSNLKATSDGLEGLKLSAAAKTELTDLKDKVDELVKTICSAGTYKASDSSCKPVTACKKGQYMVALATATSNTDCRPTSKCSDTEFIFLESSTFTNTICRPASVCMSNEFQSVAPTRTSDRICAALTTCITGVTFQTKAPTKTSDRQCKQVTTCTDGKLILTEATILKDATCYLRGERKSDPAESCRHIYEASKPEIPKDGHYYIKTKSRPLGFKVFCWFSDSDWRGATLVLRRPGRVSGMEQHTNERNVDACKPDYNGYCKLSDQVINELKDKSPEKDPYISLSYKSGVTKPRCHAFIKKACTFTLRDGGTPQSTCSNAHIRNSGYYCNNNAPHRVYRGFDSHHCPNSNNYNSHKNKYASHDKVTHNTQPFIIFEHSGGSHYCGGWDTTWQRIELWIH